MIISTSDTKEEEEIIYDLLVEIFYFDNKLQIGVMPKIPTQQTIDNLIKFASVEDAKQFVRLQTKTPNSLWDLIRTPHQRNYYGEN